jgi:putative tricarboxylic transport membrane protein
LSGEVDFLIGVTTTGIRFVRDGKLRMLAILGPERYDQAPDVPTISELGYKDFPYIPFVRGVMAPPNVPADRLVILEEAFKKAVDDPGFKEIMAKQGKGGVAIGISMISSFIGGFIGLAGLIFLSPIIADFALKFQPAEYFMLAVLGLVLISASAKGSIIKSFIAGGFGFLVSSISMDLMAGYARFAFGTAYLRGGIPLVPMVIGLFAFSEVFVLIESGDKTISEKGELSGSIFDGLKVPFRHLRTLIRSSLIGLGIGVIPGEGSAVANFTAYLTEARISKKGDQFGSGVPEGVITPEASNNACVLGALVPTLTLGIPGGGVAAVFMGGIMLHGLNPGFELFTRNLDILTTLFFGLIIANFVLLISGSILSRYAARVTVIPINILAPSIVTLGVLSTYAIRSHILDVVAAILAGILGYFMKRYGYSTIPLSLAYAVINLCPFLIISQILILLAPDQK